MEAAWYDVLHPESMQHQTDVCALPKVGDHMTLGPYAVHSIRQQLVKASGDDCTDCDSIDVDRRLYGAGDFTIKPTGNQTILRAGGVATLIVSDPDKFVLDANAKTGVQKGLAKKAGMADASVMVMLSTFSSRRLLGRQLATKKVKVDYVIEFVVTSGGGTTDADKLLATLMAIDTTALATEIMTQIEVASGSKTTYMVTVETFTAPTAISILDSTGAVVDVKPKVVAPPAGTAAGGSISKADISMASILLVLLAQVLA